MVMEAGDGGLQLPLHCGFSFIVFYNEDLWQTEHFCSLFGAIALSDRFVGDTSLAMNGLVHCAFVLLFASQTSLRQCDWQGRASGPFQSSQVFQQGMPRAD